MGHPQPPTLIETDSQSGHGVVMGTMQQKRSKAIDITMQHALNDIATTMSKGTDQTLCAVQKLLDYAH